MKINKIFAYVICFLFLIIFIPTNLLALEKKQITDDAIWKQKISTLNFINYEKGKNHNLTIPNSNAQMNILENEYYLLNEDVRQYAWWAFGHDTENNTMIIGPDYVIYMYYNDDGYVKIDDWEKVNPTDLIEQMRKANQKIDDTKTYAKEINWIYKPALDRTNNIVSYSYGVLWSDGNKSMETKNLILGKAGYLSQTFVFEELSNPKENSEYALDTAKFVKFNEGYTYQNFTSGDKIAAVGIGALVAGSLGVKAMKSAGSVAAATGGLLLFLKKFWWILLAPLAFLGKFFNSGDKKGEEEVSSENSKRRKVKK